MPTEMPPATEPSTATANDVGTNPGAVVPSAVHKPAAAVDESAMPVLADTTAASSSSAAAPVPVRAR